MGAAFIWDYSINFEPLGKKRKNSNAASKRWKTVAATY